MARPLRPGAIEPLGEPIAASLAIDLRERTGAPRRRAPGRPGREACAEGSGTTRRPSIQLRVRTVYRITCNRNASDDRSSLGQAMHRLTSGVLEAPRSLWPSSDPGIMIPSSSVESRATTISFQPNRGDATDMTETGILETPAVTRLEVLLEEATRSSASGVRRFVEPAAGTLTRATSRTHHIVFGRRGSGKSSLLRKAAQDLTVDRRPIAFVDLESFKGHEYPDVLISVLLRNA